MKKLISIMLSLVLIFSLTGCETTSDTKKNAITIVLDWTPNTNHTGIYVALEKGYLKLNHIEQDDDLDLIKSTEEYKFRAASRFMN